jgi:hypothetical protein
VFYFVAATVEAGGRKAAAHLERCPNDQDRVHIIVTGVPRADEA